MIRRATAVFLLFSSTLGVLWAADPLPEPAPPQLLRVMITPQVIEVDKTVSWEQSLEKDALPGVPVVVNINAEGLAIRVTVTSFVRGRDLLLVVQGNIRQTKVEGTRQSSTLQSLLVPPGEPIAYFPLGRDPEGTGRQMVIFIRVEFLGE